MDGNVYGWDLVKNARVDDVNMLNRTTSYTGLVAEFASKESKFNRVAVCGSEGDFLEMSWQEDKRESHVIKSITSSKSGDPRDLVTSLALSNNKKFLFAGTAGGNVK